MSELKKDQVYQNLRGKIDNGEFAHGDKLPPERDLSRSLGVSMSTLRSALAHLERDGLLNRIRSQGTYVKLDGASTRKRYGRIACIVRPPSWTHSAGNYQNHLSISLLNEVLKHDFQVLYPSNVISLLRHSPSGETLSSIVSEISALAGQVDAFVIDQRIPDSSLACLEDLQKPVVILDRKTELNVDSVSFDHSSAIKAQVGLAIKMGYERFAVCRIDRFQNDCERFQTYNKTLLSHGIDQKRIEILDGWMDSNAGKLAKRTKEIVEEKSHLKTIIFAGSDAVGKFIVDRIKNWDMRHCGKIGVMGYGGEETAKELCTVILEPAKLASRTMEVLIKRLNAEIPFEPSASLVETRLELGNSV